MGNASFLQESFLGGIWSQTAQGALRDPRYKMAMNESLNTLPIEVGAATRRPGTRFCGTTRGGVAGRVISFSFKEDAPYNMEFTNGYLRFWNGPSLVMTNDQQAVASISSASPAKVATSLVHGWTSGNVKFNTLGVNNPKLQNRVFTITVTSTTEFTIADAVTGAAIDGSTLGTFVSGNVTRVLELTTIYTLGTWSALRSVQAETKTVLMNGLQQPQLLSVVTAPSPGAFATFSLNPFNFLDGPYLDPISGSFMTPGSLNGVVTMTLSTQAYDSTRAYNIGDFVTDSGVTYQSLQGNNAGHTPASSGAYWLVVNAGAAVGPNGFQNSDVGRLVRAYSEPPLWAVGSSYVAKDTVSYPSTVDGVNVYYTATASIAAGIAPGTTTSWAITPNAATWTWGRITGVSGTGLITPVAAVGTMTAGGGVAAAFDGTNTHSYSTSASYTTNIDAAPVWISGAAYGAGAHVYYAYNASLYSCDHTFTVWNAGNYVVGDLVWYLDRYYRCIGNGTGSNNYPTSGNGNWTDLGIGEPLNVNIWTLIEAAPQTTLDQYVGQHYSVAKALFQATVYPSNDNGFSDTPGGTITLRLRAKATVPSSASDGTLLGSVIVSNNFSAVTIPSNDTTTTWNYVWIEILAYYPQPLTPTGTNVFAAHLSISQVLFYTPNVANGSVITVQIEGPALLYSGTIRTWRLGVYSDTSGWPTCGVYHEGRLWLAGSVGNRIDASTSGNIFDFSPTSDTGTVSDSNAISYIFDSKDVNTIFWGDQDQQGIIWGTQAGEWLVQASALNNPLTPTNIQAHRVTKIGCANIEPRRTEHTLVFVQKHQRKLMEYFADVYSGKFSAPNLSEKAKHLTKTGIAEIAYQQELAPVVWARCGNGTLIGSTYKRDSLLSSQGPTFTAWHRHTFGSGRLVESICVGPSQDGTLDSLAMVTNDATGVRHVELLTDLFEEGANLLTAWFCDDAVVPSSYTTGVVSGGASGVTFNGLWHLNGQTVSIFAGGLDLGDGVVASGSVSVAFGGNVLFTSTFVSSFNGLMPCVVGFTYTTQGQLVEPNTQPESGARNGPGFGKVKRIHKYAASLVDTQGISFGTDFTTMKPAQLKTPGKTALIAANTLFSGTHKDTMQDPGGFDGSMLAWQQTRPFPGTIAGLGGFLETVDE